MVFLSIKSLPNLLSGVLCLPGDQSHPVWATVNKPSCVLHLLGWFIGSRGFSSLEQRPEFWVLQYLEVSKKGNYSVISSQETNKKLFETISELKKAASTYSARSQV